MALIKKMTIVKRTLLWLISISVMWFGVITFIVLEVRERVRDDGLNDVQEVLSHKTDMLNHYLSSVFESLDSLSRFFEFASLRDPIFNQSFWERNNNELDFIAREKLDGFYDVFLITKSGDIVFTVKHESDLHTNLYTGPYKNSQLAKVFRDSLKNIHPYVSDFEYYEPSKDYAAFMAKPVVQGGKIIGILAVQIDNKRIQSLINDYHELGKSGEVLAAVERNGKWIAMARARHSGYGAYDEIKTPICFPAKEALNGHRGVDYSKDRDGNAIAVAWDYVTQLGWVVAVSIHENELLNEWYRLMTSLIVLLFNGIFVIGFMVVMAFRSFSGPIQELTQKAARISEGDYDVDFNVAKYDYEWQVLIRGFKQMSQEIKRKIIQLKEQYDLLKRHKREIEDLNRTLEKRIQIKSKKLQEYINIVDQYVITSQTDTRGMITYVSDAFSKISGYAKEELIGKTHSIIRHPDMHDEVFADLWTTIKAGLVWRGEIKNLKKDGGYYWVDTMISPMIENGTVIGYTAVRHDITDQKIIEEMAITDAMTGLFNRRHYVKTVQNEINRAKRNRYSLALMMIDVDNFKLYNDTYGHQEGDEVLSSVAAILKHYTSRGGESAFRMGGEEFAILVGNLALEEYSELAERIRQEVEALAIPHEKNDAGPYVTISIGIALWQPESPVSYEELYRKADIQLYRAKEEGRNRVCIAIESGPS